MVENPVDEGPQAAVADRRSWSWFACALLLLPFCNGADSIPFMAWLAPVFRCVSCGGKHHSWVCQPLISP